MKGKSDKWESVSKAADISTLSGVNFIVMFSLLAGTLAGGGLLASSIGNSQEEGTDGDNTVVADPPAGSTTGPTQTPTPSLSPSESEPTPTPEPIEEIDTTTNPPPEPEPNDPNPEAGCTTASIDIHINTDNNNAKAGQNAYESTRTFNTDAEIVGDCGGLNRDNNCELSFDAYMDGSRIASEYGSCQMSMSVSTRNHAPGQLRLVYTVNYDDITEVAEKTVSIV